MAPIILYIDIRKHMRFLAFMSLFFSLGLCASERMVVFDAASYVDSLKEEGKGDKEANLIVALAGSYRAGFRDGYCRGKKWKRISDYQRVINRGVYSIVEGNVGKADMLNYVGQSLQIVESLKEKDMKEIDRYRNDSSAVGVAKFDYLCTKLIDEERARWGASAYEISEEIGERKGTEKRAPRAPD